MKRLKKTKRPLILTVNGKAEAVVQDAEAYQHLLDIAAQADAVEGIQQGLEDLKKGRVRPAREALKCSAAFMKYLVRPDRPLLAGRGSNLHALRSGCFPARVRLVQSSRQCNL